MKNKNLIQVVQKIAEIQIEGLKRVQQNPEGYDISGLIKEVLASGSTEFQKGLQERIKQWENILETPVLFKTLDLYQLGVSAHILYVIEEDLLRYNADGVIECWELIDSLYQLYHPEVKILNLDLWKLKNLSKS